MSEKEIVEKSDYPVTKKKLIKDFKNGGLKKGSTVIVHSSLSSLGWVCGGPVTLIDALMEVITKSGNIIMPTHNGNYSEPKYWGNPAVPESWWDSIRNEMPAFRPEVTPTRGVGVVPENFRKYPNTVRSSHPINSFAAWGKNADEIIANHDLNSSLGEKSPLQKIYDLNGKILLIGVGHESNTSLHLAEYKADFKKETKEYGAPIIKDGKRIWAKYQEIEVDSDDFHKLGNDYENKREYTKFKLAYSTAKLFSQVDIVDFAVDWFEKNR
ncbi:MAG TPA: AAC(3) family N-acetyltransferase [Halanaerobiales bacterium]|nr:AAC(3) family N-acetyltransferase [Halanaerobiales bacterium]